MSVATLDGVPESGERRFERGAVSNGKNFCPFADAADKVGQHFARSELQEQITPELINHVFDALSPSDSSGHLAGQA